MSSSQRSAPRTRNSSEGRSAMTSGWSVPRGHWPQALIWLAIGTIVLGGLSALAWSISRFPADRLGEVLLFLALASAAQRMPVSLFRNSSISVGFALAFAALVYLGPAAAVIVQLGPGLVLCVT